MAKKPLIALLAVLLPASVVLGVSTAQADSAPATDSVTITVDGKPYLGGAARSGGIVVNDDLLTYAASKVQGSAKLADGSSVSVNLSGVPLLTGRISATAKNGTKVDAVVAGGVTRKSDDVLEWSGPAIVGKSLKTIGITIRDDETDPGYHLVRMRHAGQDRTAFVRVPPRRAGGSTTPVVFRFPGLLENAAAADQFEHPAVAADKHGYLMVIAEHYGFGWQRVPAGTPGPDVDDTGFVRELAAHVQQRFGGDPHRTYASGMSNGGFFTSLAACELTDVFAAFAPVSGQLTLTTCEPGRPIPVLMMHGDADPIVAYSGVAPATATWLKNNGCGTTSADTLLPDTDPADGTRVIRHIYQGCPANAPVVLYQIQNGGHAWPGGTPYPVDLGRTTQDIDANELIWQFVSQFTH